MEAAFFFAEAFLAEVFLLEEDEEDAEELDDLRPVRRFLRGLGETSLPSPPAATAA